MIGRTLGHYHITGLLDKDGLGEVYRARDTKLERDVALKMLPADVAKVKFDVKPPNETTDT